MNLTKLLPVTMCLLMGYSSAPQPAKPIPLTSTSSQSDLRAIEVERQRETQTPCSPEWLKKATEGQRKNCIRQSSINQAVEALSTHPSDVKQDSSRSSNQH